MKKLKENLKNIGFGVLFLVLIVWAIYRGYVKQSNDPLTEAVESLQKIRTFSLDADEYIEAYATISILINNCDSYAEMYWVDKSICSENDPDFKLSKYRLNTVLTPLYECYSDLDSYFSKIINYQDKVWNCLIKERKQDCSILYIPSYILKECEVSLTRYKEMVEWDCIDENKSDCKDEIKDLNKTINAIKNLKDYTALHK